MPEKKKEIMLPTASDETPVRNFILLVLLIPAAPFIMIYSIVTGRLQNPFIVGACLTMMLGTGAYYIYDRYSEHTPTRQEQIQALFEETSTKEQKELSKKTSTLRLSLGQELPKQLEPMLDIKQDMLTINYYYFLTKTGYMGDNAEGAVYVLQNALYSSNRNLAEAAWKSLSLIGTNEAKKIKDIFVKENAVAQKLQEEKQKQVKFQKKFYAKDPTFIDSIKNDLLNFKNKF